MVTVTNRLKTYPIVRGDLSIKLLNQNLKQQIKNKVQGIMQLRNRIVVVA